jgi:uncharacterized protein (TIGR02466 family)
MNNRESVMLIGAVPAFCKILPNIDENVIEYVKNIQYEDFASKTGYVSCDKKILENENLKKLKEIIEESVLIYTNKILGMKNNLKFKITNSWVNKHKENDYIPEHSHSNCLISGVLYLQTNPDSGDFLIKNLNSFSNLIVPDFENTTIFNLSHFRIKPENNMIVLFPSHLIHMAEKNKSPMDRYSLAFDFFPFGSVNNQFGQIQYLEPIIN